MHATPRAMNWADFTNVWVMKIMEYEPTESHNGTDTHNGSMVNFIKQDPIVLSTLFSRNQEYVSKVTNITGNVFCHVIDSHSQRSIRGWG